MDGQFCLLLVVLTVTSVIAQQPEIVEEIREEVKPKNGRAYLNCTVVNVVNQQVLWTKDKVQSTDVAFPISQDKQIMDDRNTEIGQNEDSGEPKYEVIVTEYTKGSQKRKTFTLVINYLREEDSGNYTCAIKTQGTSSREWPKKKGHLLVQRAPTIKNIVDTDLIVIRGETVSINCDAQGNPSPNITWVREDGSMFTNGQTIIRGKTLRIESAVKEDTGTYRCIADNSVRPPDSISIQIKMHGSPLCKAIQDTVGQAQNRRFSAKLECVVEAFPAADVHFEKRVNQVPVKLNDDPRYEVTQMDPSQSSKATELWYVLKIKNVKAEDYTDYWCVATNKYGDSRVHFAVYETMECQGTNCPSISTGGANALCGCFTTILSICLAVIILKFFKY